METGMYKAIRNEAVADVNLFAAWNMSFFKGNGHGWRELRNCDMRGKLKDIAVASGKTVVMATAEELESSK